MAGGQTDGSTWAPVWGATWQGRLVGGGPTGIVGPWLDIRGGNALALNRPPIYTGFVSKFSPCGTMFPHGFIL